MDPSIVIIRPVQRKRKLTDKQRLNFPFKGLLTTSQCLKIIELSKTLSVEELSKRYNIAPYHIKNIILGKDFPVCRKLNRRDRRISKLFG